MTLIDTKYIDSWNYIQLYAEESGTSKANNTSTVKTKLTLHVVSGGWVETGYSAGYVSGANETQLSNYYGPGDYTLLQGQLTVAHNADGSGTANLTGWFGIVQNSGWTSWGVGGSLSLTKFNRVATINSFTGTDIKGNFKATYTTQVSGLSYKLRISIPNVTTLETYSSYSSGTDVTLSSSSINYIKTNYPSAKTIQLGGVIETWSGSTKIGESSEIKITVNIKKPARIRISGAWKEATPYVRVNGAWKEAVPYMRVNGAWKEEN